MANEILLNSELIRSNFNVKIIQLNRDSLQLGGELSVVALLADLKITWKIFKELMVFKPLLTYVGIAQTRLGLWRDCGWIWLATLAGCKALSHMHGGHYRNLFDQELDGLTRRFVQLSLARLQGIIVLDSTLRYLCRGLVADERIFVLRNGIPAYCDKKQIAEASRRRANRQKLVVTYLSNLLPGKGFFTFLEAAAVLQEEGLGQNFRFNLAGAAPTPETAAQVKDFVRSRNLENSVRILGKVIGLEKNQLLLDSDVFVFPTQYPAEGQPIVIIEALAAGLPVITTARGCIPAMVRDGVNGFIVREGTPGELADRLKLLGADGPQRLAMGAASREIFQENYTAEKFVQGFAAILAKVIGKS